MSIDNSACLHAPIFIDFYPSILTSAKQTEAPKISAHFPRSPACAARPRVKGLDERANNTRP